MDKMDIERRYVRIYGQLAGFERAAHDPRRRGKGATTALIRAAAGTYGAIVVDNARQADSIRQNPEFSSDRVRLVSSHASGHLELTLHGFEGPVFFDNHAIAEMAHEVADGVGKIVDMAIKCEDERERLEVELKEMKARLDAAECKVLLLTAERDTLRALIT